MKEVGLQTRYDAFGNLFGRLEGVEPDLPPVMTGSHIDGPPNGGLYDGTIGVLCAIESLRLIKKYGLVTRRPIEIAVIRCEHLDRFGISCLGSRALSGKLNKDHLTTLKDEDGVTLEEAIRRSGFYPEKLSAVNLQGKVHSFVELHIEQGRVLEDKEKRIGVVTGIPGPTRFRITIEGTADHSGGTPMSVRKDALNGAAEIVLGLEQLAKNTKSSVGTVGILNVYPGAVHTIPGEVVFYVDIRGVEAGEKIELVEKFKDLVETTVANRDLKMTMSQTVDENPVPCSTHIIEVLKKTCEKADGDYLIMPSGGGHDTQHIAAVTNVGMLFLPSVDGISHTPNEFTKLEDLTFGSEILAEALCGLAEE
jgi:N-carbamoyl-L-amino-acid hydrolase